jgi:DNA-binding transcriptional ArsR family regulator
VTCRVDSATFVMSSCVERVEPGERSGLVAGGFVERAAVPRADRRDLKWTDHHPLVILLSVDAAIFSALAVPNRLQIVEVLRSGPQTVGALARRLELKQPLVSNHLKVLSQVRLVQFRPVAQQRFYELRAEPFQEINNWASAFETLWAERLDRFEAQLQALHDNTDISSPPKKTIIEGHSV